MNTEKTNRLLNRVAIVAGAGSCDSPNNPDIVGNGRAASILLARAGALVVLVDSNLAWAQRTQELIESAAPDFSHGPNRTFVIRGDVTSPSDCEAVVRTTMEKWGRLDILVNNVGIGGADGTAVEVEIEEWRRGMDVNVMGMVLMAKYAIPEMLKTSPSDISRGTGKAIVNMSSVAGLQGGKQITFNACFVVNKGSARPFRRALPPVSNLQGCHHQPNASDGGAPWTIWHPNQLSSSGHSVHAHGSGGRYARGDTHTAKESCASAD